VNVAHQLQKIRIFFADNGFVTVLEEVTTTFVTFIEGDRISCHETTHDLAQRCLAHAEEEVKMVWNQGPCPSGIRKGIPRGKHNIEFVSLQE